MPPVSRDGSKLGGIRDRRQSLGGDKSVRRRFWHPDPLQTTCRG